MSDDRAATPTLSLIIPTRRPFSELDGKYDEAIEEIAAVGGEVVFVGGAGEALADHPPVRYVPAAERDMYRLRALGFDAVRGDVVAMGEDHAIPASGWATAILRAHAEHPSTPIVLGCLVNRTVRTTSNRANFMTYASEIVAPMPGVPNRPPASSVVSIKRGPDVELCAHEAGRFETDVIPRLHEQQLMVADDRIVVDHYQAFGFVRAVRNAFWTTRAAYAYARELNDWPRAHRRWVTKWTLRNVAPTMIREAREGRVRTNGRRRDLALVAFMASAIAIGAAVGTNRGAGRAAERLS